MTTPTPAPSEGPYKTVERRVLGNRRRWYVLCPSGRDIYVPTYAGTEQDAIDYAEELNLAHSSALASREVAELVVAAQAAHALLTDDGTQGGKAWTVKALRTALAPFAGVIK